MRELVIWCEGARVGTVCEDARGGVWQLDYDPEWATSPGGFALAPSLPLGPTAIVDGRDEAPVRWFFDNLLPDGPIRDALARHVRIPVFDLMGLLARFGEESAGALTLLQHGAEPAPGHYDVLPVAELSRLIARLPGMPLLSVEGRARMSLAGAQHKLPLHRGPGGEFLLPRGGAASSCIIKPPIPGGAFPFAPANEHFCMALARQCGLVAPVTELLHLPEPLYVVQRYDRSVSPDGQVRRGHQIDLCQLLGKSPAYKYEEDGGVTLTQTFRASAALRQPAVARLHLLRWLVYNYLIGNSDAHGKNVSFLVGPRGIDLAPTYDLLSVRAYGLDHDYLAMSVHEEVRYGWIGREHWVGFARAAGLGPAIVFKVLDELSRKIEARAAALVTAPCFEPAERGFLEAEVLPIMALHVAYAREALGSGG